MARRTLSSTGAAIARALSAPSLKTRSNGWQLQQTGKFGEITLEK
jgi:hypothetical protein